MNESNHKSCRKATWLLSVAMERELTRTERVRLGLHLAICRPCRVFKRELRLMRSMMHDLVPRDLHASLLKGALSDPARERIERAIQTAQSDAE